MLVYHLERGAIINNWWSPTELNQTQSRTIVEIA